MKRKNKLMLLATITCSQYYLGCGTEIGNGIVYDETEKNQHPNAPSDGDSSLNPESPMDQEAASILILKLANSCGTPIAQGAIGSYESHSESFNISKLEDGKLLIKVQNQSEIVAINEDTESFYDITWQNTSDQPSYQCQQEDDFSITNPSFRVNSVDSGSFLISWSIADDGTPNSIRIDGLTFQKKP
ncbi:hypothetical protein [Pseudobacteriovorax antillogorgiicola]|uniref:Uncharacterized protein n=1 Tax=Pseudobacteriovorax antillogorgiicola TaxID=1513793 RepID=A0A1Y6CU70_9BACT|nr:hypothetical protein [Pseudobacteriovorax antillogorgiicola]TCS44796.1 hypothetical protein EDD56_13125 [Pseudobacteriovorax antillogorgiicola]SMF77392.1 hypothetical protein SAMN06296036_13139 [Pseudobacteriovorax antillogorgiicola]